MVGYLHIEQMLLTSPPQSSGMDLEGVAPNDKKNVKVIDVVF
jgi:hypothetical protein